jgi:hypothetical protein
MIPFPGAPDNADAGLEDGFLAVPAKDVGAMFNPILAEVVSLVDGQIKKLRNKRKTVRGLVVVGGFGQSRCLFKVLKYHFSHRAGITDPGNGGLTILQPANAWTAVVRGAVLRGLEGVELVVSRKSRRHYGVYARTPFDASVHPPDCKEWDSLEGSWKAADRMTWYIKKGWTVSSTEPKTFPFYHTFQMGESKIISLPLIICDTNNAPKGFDRRSGASTKVMCRLTVDLTTVPTRYWKFPASNSGARYERLDYEIGMQIQSGGLKFDLRLDGTVYGDVMAAFE